MWFNHSMKRKAPTHVIRIVQLVGGCLGVVLGVLYSGWVLANSVDVKTDPQFEIQILLIALAIGSGAAVALAAPYITIEPYLWLDDFLSNAPIPEVIAVTISLVVGLAITALSVAAFSVIPFHLGVFIGLLFGGGLMYLGVTTSRKRYREVVHLFGDRSTRKLSMDIVTPAGDGSASQAQEILIDTSVLIDSRISDVAATGFLQGTLVIPSFVLEELQRIADASDPMRRARGRRGLNVAEALRKAPSPPCIVLETEFPNMNEDVDARLIKLARIRSAALMTNDYNLNRLATVEDIRVLNLNELVNALKPVSSVGELMHVSIVKEGREHNQGIGYLEDGTMVVVESGKKHIGEEIDVMVTNLLQTPSGRMIFAQLPDGNDDLPHGHEIHAKGE